MTNHEALEALETTTVSVSIRGRSSTYRNLHQV